MSIQLVSVQTSLTYNYSVSQYLSANIFLCMVELSYVTGALLQRHKPLYCNEIRNTTGETTTRYETTRGGGGKVQYSNYFPRYSTISSNVLLSAANSEPRWRKRVSGSSGVLLKETRAFFSGGALRRFDLRVVITLASSWTLLPDALAAFPFPPLGPLAIKPSTDPSSPSSASEAMNVSSFLFGVSVFGETGSGLTGSSLTVATFGLTLRVRRMTVNSINIS